MPKNKVSQPFVEVGGSGLRRYAGFVQEEFLSELKGPRGVKIYNEMRNNEATVGAMLRATKDTIRSVSWQVEPGGNKRVDKKAASWLETCLIDCSHSWNDMISEITTFIPFGWALLEPTFKYRKGQNHDPSSKYNDGTIGWRKVVLRGQDSLAEWILDENGGIHGMIQIAPPDYQRREIRKFILFRTDKEKNNPEGLSLLRAAYKSYYMKRSLEELEAIGVERDLTGFPWIQLPHGATEDDFKKAKEILEKIKVDEMGGLITYQGVDEFSTWKFSLLNSPGQKTLDTEKIIQRYTGEIAMSFLAQFLRLGQQRVGSYALSRDQKDFFYLSITAILDIIEETINNFMIPQLFHLNPVFKLDNLPRITHRKVGQRDIAQFVKALETAVGAGLIGEVDTILQRFVRDEMGLPDLVEDTIVPMEHN